MCAQTELLTAVAVSWRHSYGDSIVSSLAAVVDTWQQVGAISSRTAKIKLIAACLLETAAHEVSIAVAFLAGETRQGKLGVGYASLQAARSTQPAPQSTLSLSEVERRFGEFVLTKGKGSVESRNLQLRELFGLATAAEQDFLLRLMVGELRQGALQGVMLEAIAATSKLPVADVRRAAMFGASIADVAQIAITEGAAGLSRFHQQTLSAVAPMLAQTAVDTDDALEQLGEAAFEWKLDGARVHVHRLNDEVRLFTRNSNDVTAAAPEVVEAIRALPTREFILDGEVIALKPDGRPQPFQITMRRFGRKLNVDALRPELPLSLFCFDCLRSGDVDQIDKGEAERFAALKEIVPASMLIPRLVTADKAIAARFYEDALAHGHEGVMAKALDSLYEAGNRGASWLKIKHVHTLDLVVLAAEWGNGRRKGFLSNLHLGALDPSTGEFVMLGKTFKGLTDELLKWQTAQFLAREVSRDSYTVYVRPELVVEIAFNDLQSSSQYAGGLALRFARVKRYREDKTVADADTIQTVRQVYAAQGGGDLRASEPSDSGA
jgi:DNA ligase 1